MSNYNWCHGPKCHENRTQDRIRGVKGNKVLRTRKITENNWNRGNIGLCFVVKVATPISFISIGNKSLRLRQGPSLKKHLLKFRLKLLLIGEDSLINKKL